MKYLTIILFLFISLLNCGTTVHSTRISDNYYDPLPPEADVKVFYTKRPKNYDEIAIIKLVHTLNESNQIERIHKAKNKARQMGGDGIIVLDAKVDRYEKLPDLEIQEFVIIKILNSE